MAPLFDSLSRQNLTESVLSSVLSFAQWNLILTHLQHSNFESKQSLTLFGPKQNPLNISHSPFRSYFNQMLAFFSYFDKIYTYSNNSQSLWLIQNSLSLKVFTPIKTLTQCEIYQQGTLVLCGVNHHRFGAEAWSGLWMAVCTTQSDTKPACRAKCGRVLRFGKANIANIPCNECPLESKHTLQWM